MKILVSIFVSMIVVLSYQASAETKFIKYKKYLIPITVDDQTPYNECPAGSKPKVIVSTDVAQSGQGADDDDIQSMVHYLASSYRFDTLGFISSPGDKPNQQGTNTGGTVAFINQIISAYATDYSGVTGYQNSSSFAVKEGLRTVPTTIGPYNPSIADHAGAKFIKEEAEKILLKQTCGPLYVLTWGPLSDLALALSANPEIAKVIRVYAAAGSYNKGNGTSTNHIYSYNYIETNFLNDDKLWFIESNTTHSGMYSTQSSTTQTAVKNNLSNYGCLGGILANTNPNNPLKAGDTPSVLYLMNGDRNDPITPSWGGQFRINSASHTQYWRDIYSNPQGTITPHGTINNSNSIYGAWYADMVKAGLGCN